MNVDAIQVRLAVRPPIEAQDLGLQLLRRNARTSLCAAAIAVAPVWVVVAAILGPTSVAAGLFLWWSKPLIGRVVLHVLSRAVFGDAPRVGETLAHLPKLFDRALVSALTWRRIGLQRSFWMPVAALEGLRGAELRERQSLLARGHAGGVATWITLGFLCMEFALGMALYLLVSLVLPGGVAAGFEAFLDLESASAVFRWASTATWIPAVIVIESAYTAAGFGPYLGRRTDLEGWDVDLALMRLGRRVAAALRHGAAVILVGVCLVAMAAPVAAQDSGPQEPTSERDPKQVAEAVLEHPDFETEVVRRRPKLDFLDEMGGSSAFSAVVAPLLKVAALVLLVVTIVALVVYFARRAEIPHRPEHRAKAPPVESAFGLDLRADSLPSDIVAAARGHVTRGEFVPALSLLYRGALARLVDSETLEIRPGDTEHDCMRHVRHAGDEGRATYFAGLTDAWLRAAWGASAPTEPAARALCDGWGEHFGGHAG